MKRLGIAACVVLAVLGIACDPDAQPDAAPPSSGPIVKTRKAPPPIVNKNVSGSKVAVPERKSSAAARPARPPLWTRRRVLLRRRVGHSLCRLSGSPLRMPDSVRQL